MSVNFKHTVVQLTNAGEQNVGTFTVNHAFGNNAMREFLRIAKRSTGASIRRVPDQTLASYHYSTIDGAVSFELR